MTGVLVDTSVWVDHFRRHNGALAERFSAQHLPQVH